MKQADIDALPTDVTALKREVVRLNDMIESYEAAKRQRKAEEAIAATSDAATFEIDVFTVRSDLESLADGSTDITDPIERGRIVRSAVSLINRLFAAVPKQ